MIKFKLKNFNIDFDRNYGCANKTGWSIAVDGHYYISFEKHLIIALIKTFKKIVVEE